MAYKSAEGLNQHKQRGSELLHSEWNAAARAAGADVSLAIGGTDESSAASATQTKGKRKYFRVFAKEATIPPYSVFGVKAGQKNDGHDVKTTVVQFGHEHGASPGGICTNGPYQIKKGAWGWAHIIDAYEPTLIKTDAEIPIGHFCGAKWGAWVVTSQQRYGLLCISKRNNQSLQWVVGSPELTGVIGRVTEAITAFDPETDELGYGKVRLYFREKDTRKLKKAKNPANDTELWEVGVYNLTQLEFDIGKWIKAECIIGVGLVIEAPAGETSDSSESSDSVPPSSSSSSPPPSSSSPPPSSSSPPPSSSSDCPRTFQVPIAWELDQTTCTIVATDWITYHIDKDGCVTEV